MSLTETRSEFFSHVRDHHQHILTEKTDYNPTRQTIDTILWLFEVFAGHVVVGSVFDGLYVRVCPCTREFAEKLSIRKRFPPFVQILYEEANDYLSSDAALEIRIKHPDFNYGDVVVAYKELVMENRVKPK